MSYKRIAAMDISPRRIGIAFSDSYGIMVSKTFLIIPGKQIRQELQIIYEKYKPIVTYVGLPVNLDGSTSTQTRFVKTFIHNMRDIIGKYEFEDERYSTRIVEQMYSGTNLSTDEMVAVYLLSHKLLSV